MKYGTEETFQLVSQMKIALTIHHVAGQLEVVSTWNWSRQTFLWNYVTCSYAEVPLPTGDICQFAPYPG